MKLSVSPGRLCAASAAAAMGLACVCSLAPVAPPRSAVADGVLVAPSDPLTPEAEKAKIRLPPGFEIQLVAAEPDIHKPMNLNFDDRGRLWVTDTVEYPWPVKDGQVGRDTVKVLEDFGEDGRARKITTFAEGLNIPIGVLPLPAAPGGPTEALVHSIPNVWRMTDADGDGKAEKREPALTGIGFKDTHGMTASFTIGFDGRVYATHGFANSSDIKARDGSALKLNSGNTYRFLSDGTKLEQWTWGQVNPFGLTLDPAGDLFSADCHSRPIVHLLRGGFYSSFGKPHDGLGFAPEMCRHDHGSTGIAGIVRYSADHFPEEWRGLAFLGNVVTNRINLDRLDRTSPGGSTYKAVEQKDFLISADQWFRPVDIKLGPDGALYVADFYNRIIGHYEVPLTHPQRDRERGRIWRIVWRGTDGKAPAPKAPRADWTKATVPELIEDLAHPNLTVRMIAQRQLVARGLSGQGGQKDAVAEAVKPALASLDPLRRLHALWAAEQLSILPEASLTAAAKDDSPLVRTHALRAISDRPDPLPTQLHEAMLAGLEDKDATVRRTAAEAVGTHPSPGHVKPLLAALKAADPADANLVHVLRIALRNQFRPAENWKDAAALLDDEPSARAVADVAVGVASPESAAFLSAHLAKRKESRDNTARYVRHIARHGGADGVAKLEESLRGGGTDLETQLAVLKAVQQGLQERGGKVGDRERQWAGELCEKLLSAGDAGKVTAGCELAGSMRLEETRSRLAELAATKKLPEAARKAAVTALAACDPAGQSALPTLAALVSDGGDAMAVRESAAAALAGLNRPEARAELVAALPKSPERLQTAIAAGLAGRAEGAEELLKAVSSGKASARLLQDRNVSARLSGSGLKGVTARVAALTKGLPPADKKTQDLINRRLADFAAFAKTPAVGEAETLSAGAKVFERACMGCHMMGGKGAKVGPQLDGVGIRGPERLAEDILDPSRNVDEAFRTTLIKLTDERVVAGLLLREEGETVILADQAGKEVTVRKGDIDQRQVLPLSPMPGNFGEQLPDSDFRLLLAYLLTQRAAPAGGAK
jgi:putative heme-binding domain-containing protein